MAGVETAGTGTSGTGPAVETLESVKHLVSWQKGRTQHLGCHSSQKNGHGPSNPKRPEKSEHSPSENVMQVMKQLAQDISVAKIAFSSRESCMTPISWVCLKLTTETTGLEPKCYQYCQFISVPSWDTPKSHCDSMDKNMYPDCTPMIFHQNPI